MKKDNTVSLNTCSLPFVEIRTAVDSAACYHAHSHDEFSFGVIDKGAAKYMNHHAMHRIHAMDTVMINPGDVHSCNPYSEEWSYRMLFVDAEWIGEMQREIFDSSLVDYQCFSTAYETGRKRYAEFSGLYAALMQDSSALACESALVEFVAKCFTQECREDAASRKMAAHHVQRVREKLLDQLSENHSLQELATEAGLSRYHLIRKFKAIYGLTPHALQIDERIKRAKELLKQGQAIADASSQLGFADQAHFQRNFKKRLAITPKQYQSFFL